MYKNFKLTDEEKKQIMEQHKMRGYKKPLNEQGAPDEPTSIPYPTGSGPKPKPSKTPAVATNAAEKQAQQFNMSEEIDTDDEEAELSKLYNDEDEDLYDLDSDMKTGQFSSEFSDPDEWEDLHDFSVARNSIPKEKMVDKGRSGPKDIDYDRAQHFYNGIPEFMTYDASSKPKEPTSDYYLRTYGTPDPDMESETLADKKKNAPINFPKYTDKDRRNPENMLSWEEKKKLMAQREEKRIARELARQARQGRMNESIQLTESELVNLIKKIVNKAK